MNIKQVKNKKITKKLKTCNSNRKMQYSHDYVDTKNNKK